MRESCSRCFVPAAASAAAVPQARPRPVPSISTRTPAGERTTSIRNSRTIPGARRSSFRRRVSRCRQERIPTWPQGDAHAVPQRGPGWSGSERSGARIRLTRTAIGRCAESAARRLAERRRDMSEKLSRGLGRAQSTPVRHCERAMPAVASAANECPRSHGGPLLPGGVLPPGCSVFPRFPGMDAVQSSVSPSGSPGLVDSGTPLLPSILATGAG